MEHLHNGILLGQRKRGRKRQREKAREKGENFTLGDSMDGPEEHIMLSEIS